MSVAPHINAAQASGQDGSHGKKARPQPGASRSDSSDGPAGTGSAVSPRFTARRPEPLDYNKICARVHRQLAVSAGGNRDVYPSSPPGTSDTPTRGYNDTQPTTLHELTAQSSPLYPPYVEPTGLTQQPTLAYRGLSTYRVPSPSPGTTADSSPRPAPSPPSSSSSVTAIDEHHVLPSEPSLFASFSPNYRGDRTLRNCSRDDIPDDLNCSLWITNLPGDVTYTERYGKLVGNCGGCI